MAPSRGISTPTAKDWLTILQATYIVYLLKPYYRNHSKRLVKSPKLYFVDTGLLCYLLGIDSSERFFRAAERGSVFENMVVMEALKQKITTPSKQELYFYRTLRGQEVDLLIEASGKLHAYEIKLTKTPNNTMANSLTQFGKDHPGASTDLLCLRKGALTLTRSVTAKHWTSLSHP